jgi:hypothetical protein
VVREAQVGFSLLSIDTLRRAPKQAEGCVVLESQVRAPLGRNGDSGPRSAGAEAANSRPGYTDDGARNILELDSLSQHRWIESEAFSPVFVADDGNRRGEVMSECPAVKNLE